MSNDIGNKILKTVKRLEKRLEFLFKENNIEEKYNQITELENKEIWENRIKMAKVNSKDEALVKEAREYYSKKRRKKFIENRPVLYFKNNKPYWVLI